MVLGLFPLTLAGQSGSAHNYRRLDFRAKWTFAAFRTTTLDSSQLEGLLPYRKCAEQLRKLWPPRNSDSPSKIVKTHTQMTLPTESRLVPHIQGRTNPFKRLAAAVIFQAMRDATRQMGRAKKSATTWLLQNDDEFRFWCNVLGRDADQTRQELSDLLDSQMTRCKIDFQSLLQPAPQDHRVLFADPQSSE